MAEDEDCKVYVGSLSFSTTDESLKSHFSSVGDIKDGKKDFEFAWLSALYTVFENHACVVVYFKVASPKVS